MSCMTTDNFCFYLQNRLIQTSQTGGQWYSDTSPFSISCSGLFIRSISAKKFYKIDPSCATGTVFLKDLIYPLLDAKIWVRFRPYLWCIYTNKQTNTHTHSHRLTHTHTDSHTHTHSHTLTHTHTHSHTHTLTHTHSHTQKIYAYILETEALFEDTQNKDTYNNMTQHNSKKATQLITLMLYWVKCWDVYCVNNCRMYYR
jgi:hypothetical protein